MDKTKHDKIIPCILAAIVDKGKILLIHRTKEPYKDFWAMVGGKIEFAEHVEETAVREAFEETGITCKVRHVRGAITEIVHNSDGPEQHFIMFFVELEPQTTNFVESEEGKLRWFTFEELEKIKIVPSDLIMINEFILKDKKAKVYKIKVKKDKETYDVEEFV